MILKKMLAFLSAVTLSFSAVSGCFPSMSSSKHTFRAMAEEIEFSNNEELVLVTDAQKTDTETKNTDDGLSYYFEGDEIIINGYSGSSKKVVIPEIIDGIAVTTVSDYAFNGNTVITGIDLGNVKSIGGKAFAGCTELKEITIPKTVTQTGDWKYGCLEGSSISILSFEPGTTNVPSHIAQNCTALREVFLPDTVSRLDNYAFYGCSKLEKILPVNKQLDFMSDTFTGCVLLDDSRFTVLDRENSYIVSNYELASTNGISNFTLRYKLSPNVSDNAKEMQLVLKVPEGIDLMYDTFRSSDPAFAADKIKDGVIPVTQPEGELRFSARVTAIGDYRITANIIFKFGNSSWNQYIGTVNVKCPDITCCTVAKTSADTINVYGIASKGETVELYIDDVLAGEAVSSEYTGKYSTKLVLPAKESGSSYSVCAKCKDKISDPVNVIYEAGQPKIESVTMIYNGDKRMDITNVFEEGISPVISYNPSYPILFEIKTDNADKIYKVCVTSTKGASTKKVEAFWDEEKQLFISKDFFDPSNHYYVPGTLNITIEQYKTVDSKNSEPEKNPDYEPDKSIIDNSYCEIIEKKDNELLEKIVISDGSKSLETYHYYSESETMKVKGKEKRVKDIVKEYKENGFQKLNIREVEDGKVYEYYIKPLNLEDLSDLGLEDESEDDRGPFERLDDQYGFWTDRISGFLIARKELNSDNITVIKEVWKNASPEAASWFIETVAGEEASALYGDIGTVISFASNCESYFKACMEAESPEEIEAYSWLFAYNTTSLACVVLVASVNPLAGVGFGILTALGGDMLEKEIEAYFNGGGILRMIIDPSGIVYEAVPGNPVEGATVSIYYRDPETNEAVKWNAKDYEQENPLLTDKEGKYLWDVPEGDWKVVCEKEEYETAETEWLGIPPVRTDVNIALVSKTAPKLVSADMSGRSITVKLSKFVDISTVTADSFTIEGTESEFTVVAQPLSEDDKYADTFILNGSFTDSVKSVSLSDEVKSYAGIAAEKSTVTVTNIGLDLGDLNSDGKVDAKDASMILVYYSKMSTGGEGGFTEAQKNAANVNSDALIDAKDASYILAYYVAASTATGDIPSLAEYMAAKVA